METKGNRPTHCYLKYTQKTECNTQTPFNTHTPRPLQSPNTCTSACRLSPAHPTSTHPSALTYSHPTHNPHMHKHTCTQALTYTQPHLFLLLPPSASERRAARSPPCPTLERELRSARTLGPTVPSWDRAASPSGTALASAQVETHEYTSHTLKDSRKKEKTHTEHETYEWKHEHLFVTANEYLSVNSNTCLFVNSNVLTRHPDGGGQMATLQQGPKKRSLLERY